MDAAKCIVVLWSKQSIHSNWVLEEADIGKRRGILVPAKIDPVVPPLGFGLIQAADLTDWDSDTTHAEFENFLTAISDIVRPLRRPEKGAQVGNISELNLEQPPEVPHEEGAIPQSISRQSASAKETASISPTAILRLRSEPQTVPSEEAEKTFGLDENRRPVKYIENQFEDRGKVVFDRDTGLIWQKSGSQNHLAYVKTREYIEQLNREGFAGHSDWRLPTIPELMSLLTPQKQTNGLYIDPIFDANQRWCWSADKGSSGSAWLVYFLIGKMYWSFLIINY